MFSSVQTTHGLVTALVEKTECVTMTGEAHLAVEHLLFYNGVQLHAEKVVPEGTSRRRRAALRRCSIRTN